MEDFYAKAVKDPMIGHQFRKIQSFEPQDPKDVLTPPLEAFSHHLPRIASFWELQLLGSSSRKIESPFNLIQTHKKLNILPGELGRWMVLFKETLKEKREERLIELDESSPTRLMGQIQDEIDLLEKWEERAEDFRDRFLNSPHLFQNARHA